MCEALCCSASAQAKREHAFTSSLSLTPMCKSSTSLILSLSLSLEQIYARGQAKKHIHESVHRSIRTVYKRAAALGLSQLKNAFDLTSFRTAFESYICTLSPFISLLVVVVSSYIGVRSLELTLVSRIGSSLLSCSGRNFPHQHEGGLWWLGEGRVDGGWVGMC